MSVAENTVSCIIFPYTFNTLTLFLRNVGNVKPLLHEVVSFAKENGIMLNALSAKVVENLWQVWFFICDALRYLVPFIQITKREKDPLRSVEACNFTKITTLPWVFFTFFKLYKWYQIVQRTTYFLQRWI